ncbi:MAG TPA: hypothetical protein VLA34_12725 [Candidatus Krumholzibacterium sp.]|nr:hypothetical protein [Candidatus Krumholzibacterium sp.]
MTRLISTLRRWWTAFLKRAGDVVDIFKPRGYVEARLYYATGPKKGELYRVIKGRNVVTSWLSGLSGAAPTGGRDLMRRLLAPSSETGSLNGATDAAISQIELGSGTTAETAGDTALDTTLYPTYPAARRALSSVEFDASNPYVTFIFEFSESEVNTTISEAALLSGPSRNDFVARKTFGAFPKTSDFTLQIRWQIRF